MVIGIPTDHTTAATAMELLLFDTIDNGGKPNGKQNGAHYDNSNDNRQIDHAIRNACPILYHYLYGGIEKPNRE